MSKDPDKNLELNKTAAAPAAAGVRPGSRLARGSLASFLAGLLALALAAVALVLAFHTGPSGAWLLSINDAWMGFACLLFAAAAGCWLASLICGLIVVRRHPRVLWWLSAILILAGSVAAFALAD